LSTEGKDEHHTGVNARLLVGVTRLGTVNKFVTSEYG